MRILVSGSTRAVRQVAARYPAYLGHLTTPRNGNRPGALAGTGLPWAADNGAFSGLDPALFRKLLARVRTLSSGGEMDHERFLGPA